MLQTIGMNLTLGAAQQFNAASGNLTASGTINNGGNALTVTGGSNTTLSGNISGSRLINQNRRRHAAPFRQQQLQRRHHGQPAARCSWATPTPWAPTRRRDGQFGGTLDLHGFSPTIGALNGTGGAVQKNVAGAVALTVGNGGAGGSYAGTIQKVRARFR